MSKSKPFKFMFASVLMLMMVVAIVLLLTSPKRKHHAETLVCPPHQRMISSVGGGNPKCETLFPGPSVPVGKIFSQAGLKKFRGSKTREMVYDFKIPAPGKRVMVLIHGLGDDMFALQKIAELAENDGFGILRVDLHGHGATLENALANNDKKLPNEIDYRENVDDIKKLLRYLNIKNATVVGHSYGGGIALKVSEEMSPQYIYSVHAMAPYVQRIDKYIAQRMTSPDFLIASTDTKAEKIGVPKPIVNIFEPFVILTWRMTRSIKRAQDMSNAMLGLDKVKDALFDPVMHQFMEKAYRSHFLKGLGKSEQELTDQEKQLLDAQVEAAILVTKGVRGLDYLDATTKIGKFPKLVQVIGGAKDRLVVPEQLKTFSLRLTQAGVEHQLTEIDGDGAGHMFPQTMSEEVYALITQSIAKQAASEKP